MPVLPTTGKNTGNRTDMSRPPGPFPESGAAGGEPGIRNRGLAGSHSTERPPVRFIDLEAQQERIKEAIDANIQKVLAHGRYVMGPEVAELEQRLSAYVGCRHAVGCSSGTDALLLTLMALEVGPGDAVFTTPFTFVATAEAVRLLGATPVFVDIDPGTFNLDPRRLELAVEALRSGDAALHPLPNDRANPERRLRPRPRGVLPVDLFGLAADYPRIEAVAERYGLFVVEDAAQSLGAEAHGRKAGSFGTAAATSFFPAKPLGGYGDGGMCFTDDDALADRIRSLRQHGRGGHKYDNARIGLNGRLDTLQAAVLLAKLDIFPEEILLRRKKANRYTELLTAMARLHAPCLPPGHASAWAQYSLLTESPETREIIQGSLKEKGIPTAVYYPTPMHLQRAFADLGYEEGSFPVSEDVSRRIFSLPMHPYLGEAEQDFIVTALRSVCYTFGERTPTGAAGGVPAPSPSNLGWKR